jgi:adenosylcobalamin-dependent ribonucleoside-triphosphate reductase
MSITLESKQQYFNLVKPQYISWNFYKDYINVEPNFGELGLVVYLRTYSRFVEELNRREKWCETVLRVVEYSLSLDTVSTKENKIKEAEELFDAVFNLRLFPAGRTLWIGGSKQTEVDGSANWNCTYCNIDTISSFSEIFYWLMIGAGTGFSVEQKHISKLPKFYANKQLVHQDYNYNNSNYEHTTIQGYLNNLTNGVGTLFKHAICLTDSDYINPLKNDLEIFNRYIIKIGDSKEGWCNALRLLLTLCTSDKELIIEFNYDNIRPKGELIKTFGGRSSGYKNLQQVLEDTYKILVRSNGLIDSLAALDIINIIGRGVVSGGVRRTAEIALGDSTDVEFIEAKYNLWSDENKQPYQDIRVMSNNSLMFYEKPSCEELEQVVNRIRNNGEPGFYIIGNARKYDDLIEGTNPCGETGLRNKQTCNLTTTNPYYHITEDNGFCWNSWIDTLKLATRAGSRISTITQWHPEWDKVQKSQRLLGVSMTGIMDTVDRLKWTKEQLEDFLKVSADIVRQEADKYHKELGIERSARVSLFKPEGTLSQLPTVSSGIHRSYAESYYRRIRFSSQDPLALALYDLNIPVVPENSQGDKLFDEKCNTWVFTFPVKTNAEIRAIDESSIDQLERYKLAMTTYVRDGHNCSVTITVADNEWEEVTKWIYNNWDYCIGLTLLPKFDPVEGGKAMYPNMPYEPCTLDDYNNLKSKLPVLKEEELINLVSNYESNYEEQKLDSSCDTGSCPVR